MHVHDFLLLIPGGFLGFLAWLAYRRLPSDWLVEYGETAIPPELAPKLRSPFLPDGLFLTSLAAGLVLFGWLRIQPLVLFIPYLLASFLMLLILIADWKTRIIPDPLSAGLAVLALVHASIQVWTRDWNFAELGFRFLAGILAGVLFLLIGWIGSRIAGQDAMGMGDVKLIIPCVWMLDYRLALSLVFLSFLTASFFAIPLLVKKYAPRKPSETEPDGALAFGPFIVVATWLAWLFEPEISRFWYFYLGQFQ
ncbi:MAG: A24 family peptidase [Eubacteriales bacterium]|nr:A24 family peptidase [Eubacteriales bacterium]